MGKKAAKGGRKGKGGQESAQNTAALAQTPESPVGALGAGPGVRSGMRHMQRRVSLGKVTQTDLEETLRFARKIRDDPRSTKRDRMRAGELIRSIASSVDEMAAKLDRAEQGIMPMGMGGVTSSDGDGDDEPQGPVINVNLYLRGPKPPPKTA